MCDFGMTATVVSAVAAIVGTAISTVSAFQSANVQKNQYEFQAEQERQNAKIAENNATQARQSGIEEARLKRMKTLAQIGELKTANAANGININSGTAIDTLEDTATMGEYDAMTSMYKGEKTAQNFELQANNFANQSNFDTISARNVSNSGTLNAFGSALSGMGQLSRQFAGQWYEFGNQKNNYANGIKVSRWGTMA